MRFAAVEISHMAGKIKNLNFDELYRAVVCLQNEDEAAAFLEDICTVNEMKAMLQRLQVASLLDRGEQYSQIVKETGASTATISRVNRCLKYGSDGYRIVLDRLEKNKI
jgi:TrpR-related protein YerC/YecD